jgi:hypothetical protein
MSGFLSRLAARATGAPVGVTPRVPARFERADTLGDSTGVASGAPEAVSHPTSYPPVAYPPVVAPPVPAPSVPATAVSGPAMLTTKSRGAERVSADRRQLSRPGEATRDRDGHAAAVETIERAEPPGQLGVAGLSPTADQSARPQATPVPARPTAALPPIASMPATDSNTKAPANATPHVVHVSIGRVEVRAAVTPPAPVPAASAAPTPRAKTLSLAEYLRGERTGR